MFHASCDELVRQVGIYFDNKYLILTSPEKEVTKNMSTKILYIYLFYEATHFYTDDTFYFSVFAEAIRKVIHLHIYVYY